MDCSRCTIARLQGVRAYQRFPELYRRGHQRPYASSCFATLAAGDLWILRLAPTNLNDFDSDTRTRNGISSTLRRSEARQKRLLCEGYPISCSAKTGPSALHRRDTLLTDPIPNSRSKSRRECWDSAAVFTLFGFALPTSRMVDCFRCT